MVPCVSERRICTAYLAGRREKKATVSIRLGDESRNHSLRLQVQGRACFFGRDGTPVFARPIRSNDRSGRERDGT